MTLYGNLYQYFFYFASELMMSQESVRYSCYFVIGSLTMKKYLMMTVTWMSMTVCSYQFKEERTPGQLWISHNFFFFAQFSVTNFGIAGNHLVHHLSPVIFQLCETSQRVL